MGYNSDTTSDLGKALLCCAAADDWKVASSHQAVGLTRLATKPVAVMKLAAASCILEYVGL